MTEQMARSTPQEMNDARRRRAEEAAAEGAREKQEQATVREGRKTVELLLQRHADLESRVNGLYVEMDKLAKKAPTLPSTVLIVEKTNRSITAVKEFVSGPVQDFLGQDDPFLSEIDPFVPAGDQPEHRDVLVTLRDLLNILARVQTKLKRESWELAKRDKENPLSELDRVRGERDPSWQ
jgi:hypothetical protein